VDAFCATKLTKHSIHTGVKIFYTHEEAAENFASTLLPCQSLRHRDTQTNTNTMYTVVISYISVHDHVLSCSGSKNLEDVRM